MAVQAIRAMGKKETKVGPAEVIECAVPLIETPEHIRAAEIATREHNWHDLLNALVWLRFPGLKSVLNRRQVDSSVASWARPAAVRR